MLVEQLKNDATKIHQDEEAYRMFQTLLIIVQTGIFIFVTAKAGLKNYKLIK